MIKVMYVFVEIRFDPSHLVATIQRNFSSDQRLVLMGTIQFTGIVCVCVCVCVSACVHVCIQYVCVYVSVYVCMIVTIPQSTHPVIYRYARVSTTTTD